MKIKLVIAVLISSLIMGSFTVTSVYGKMMNLIQHY